jgi:hypothetical protein
VGLVYPSLTKSSALIITSALVYWFPGLCLQFFLIRSIKELTSATLNYRLASENPNVELFFYPKYEVSKKNVFGEEGVKLKYLFVQDATLKARVSGATLIHK